ncbi:hypothetical protein ACRRVB_04150 [Candidatus Cardinium hertigii]|uniref:hypothetical protein n=1 Tax=Candidatus Cardinium hertigii TaxID=247481 RepID=UPI003D7EF49D
MEWKFVLLCQMQLRLIGLLPIAIAIGCQRDAPRYEPGPIAPTEDRQQSNKAQSNIKEPTQSVSNGYASHPPDTIYNHVTLILKDIGWSDLVSAQCTDSKSKIPVLIAPPVAPHAQNDWSKCIEATAHLLDEKKTDDRAVSHGLPNRLIISFPDNQSHKSCEKPRFLATECCITAKSNPSNSKKYTYALIGCLVHVPKHSADSKEHFIRLVQSNKTWYFNKKNSKELVGISTQKAIQLASERGTIFFTKKSHK